ncbi:MAG: hypothetical protein CM15mP77_3680 [Synechococcus sp.]|nr:MAG: hypothetical protein CM15mP77_3680 [Synechococcus sp.]
MLGPISPIWVFAIAGPVGVAREKRLPGGKNTWPRSFSLNQRVPLALNTSWGIGCQEVLGKLAGGKDHPKGKR